MFDIAQHFRRLAEQHFHRHVDRHVIEMGIAQHQMLLLGGLTHHREGTALARAKRGKAIQILHAHRHHVAFLRFTTPDRHRRHARLIIGHGAQLELPAPATVMHQFRQGVGNAARTDIVNTDDGVVLAHPPAGVDDFLRPALHFRIAALHRGEIQILTALAGGHA